MPRGTRSIWPGTRAPTVFLMHKGFHTPLPADADRSAKVTQLRAISKYALTINIELRVFGGGSGCWKPLCKRSAI